MYIKPNDFPLKKMNIDIPEIQGPGKYVNDFHDVVVYDVILSTKKNIQANL